MKLWARSTIRTRLTILYAGAFFVAGACLVALMYFYLEQSLEYSPGDTALAAAQNFLDDRGAGSHSLIDNAVTAIAEQADQQRHDTLRTMLIFSLASLSGIGIAAGVLGWLLAGRALQPLHEVTATARRIADHNLHERISLAGPNDEIKDLADTFDAMLERLDRAFDGHHRFVANASHELRTPLAINRTLIEVALDDPAVPDSTRQLGETLLAVNHRHERLIDGLLVLASSEQLIDMHTRADLSAIASRVLASAEDRARRSGVRLSSHLAIAPVIGDTALLERLVGNLVDNALRYNLTDSGWVHVMVTGDTKSARMTVENTGPVVPPDEVDGLFERFRRLARDEHVNAQQSSMGGAGLGLSIVRSVATAHGGRVRATAHPQGGLTVEVTLAAAQ
ncbi:HAMP domain-containing sensor histidine kinase [soil metagenome]